MSKKQAETTDESVDNVFEGFSFLDNPVPKQVSKTTGVSTKKETKVETDNELSDEELEALEAASETQTKKTTPKKVVEDVEDVEEEEEIVTPSKTKKEDVETEEEELNPFAAFTKFLNEEGVVDLDEEDNEITSEKDLLKIVNKTISKGIASDRARLPEDAQQFLEFIDNGGRPSDFHKYYYADASFEDFDLTDDENKKYVIQEALRLEEYTDDEIKAEINDLEDLGKLDKKAEQYLKKLQKIEKENKQMLIESQKAYAMEQEALRAKEWENFRKGLFDKEEIGGFKMTPKMKEDTWNYMTKVVNKKTGETQYQIDSRENSDARYIFAYLLKNKWDIKALEKQVETKQVSKLRDKLSNYTDTRQKLKSPSTKREKEDTDESNPFKQFKKYF